jgi:hypothetical protein
MVLVQQTQWGIVEAAVLRVLAAGYTSFEALALAEKMSELGSSSAEAAAISSRSQSSLDLDDLDLPAFLRMGVDTRQGS